MRKVVITTLMILSGQQALANDCWKGNWLVGASGIYAERRGTLDVSMRYAVNPPPFPLNPAIFPILETDNLYSNKGFGWGLLVGYQLKKDGWTWGLEASVDWQDISAARDVVFTDAAFLMSWDAKSLYKREPIAALSGRMAYEMAPYFIPYIRLGIEGSDDSLDVTMISGNSLVTPNSITVSDSRWNWHYLAGVGVETPLWCTPMTVRIEYNYHSRGRPLIANGAQALISGGVLVTPAFAFSSEMHNRTQSGKLSFVWNFY